MSRAECRERLEVLRDAALAARNIFCEQIFNEGRNATRTELDTMGQLHDKANSYQELIDLFFRPIIKAATPSWVTEALY